MHLRELDHASIRNRIDAHQPLSAIAYTAVVLRVPRACSAAVSCPAPAVDCAVRGRPFLVPTRVSPDRALVHTRRPASRIMDPISAAGGGTDGALVPSASSASSVDLATISSSSLASKASGDQNFLGSKVKVEQAAAGGAAPVLTRAQRRKATVPVRSSEVWQGGVPGVKRGFPTSPHSKSLHANLKQRRL